MLDVFEREGMISRSERSERLCDNHHKLR
jgi:hypothetical protein